MSNEKWFWMSTGYKPTKRYSFYYIPEMLRKAVGYIIYFWNVLNLLVFKPYD